MNPMNPINPGQDVGVANSTNNQNLTLIRYEKFDH